MKPLPAIRFIDSALAIGGPLALPYADQGYKWIIREHLLNLFHDFPTLTPSIDTFTYENGTSLHLLNARGKLRPPASSTSTTPIPLIIWIHHSYPIFPPLVFLSSDAANPIVGNHPFVDPLSGATTSPYLTSWNYPRSNLSDLVHNLARIFAYHPPLISTSCPPPTAGWPSSASVSTVSRREAIDRLMGAMYYDLMAIKKQADEDINSLGGLQGVLRQREDVVGKLLLGLEEERSRLKKKLREMAEEKDILQNWVSVNESAAAGHGVAGGDELDGGPFEGADEESKMVIEKVAADHGIEDVIYALDEALKNGVVEFHVYQRQVRTLAKEQFFHRAVVVNIARRKSEEMRICGGLVGVDQVRSDRGVRRMHRTEQERWWS
ncbi:hypothetical protein ACLOJK_026884 [Asimina triloba]